MALAPRERPACGEASGRSHRQPQSGWPPSPWLDDILGVITPGLWGVGRIVVRRVCGPCRPSQHEPIPHPVPTNSAAYADRTRHFAPSNGQRRPLASHVRLRVRPAYPADTWQATGRGLRRAAPYPAYLLEHSPDPVGTPARDPPERSAPASDPAFVPVSKLLRWNASAQVWSLTPMRTRPPPLGHPPFGLGIATVQLGLARSVPTVVSRFELVPARSDPGLGTPKRNKQCPLDE